MIRERDRVVLTENLPAHHLKAGDVGMVALVHGDGKGYEVEVEVLKLDQRQIAKAEFRAEQVTLTTRQHIKLRQLFQNTACPSSPGRKPQRRDRFWRTCWTNRTP